MPGFVHAVFVLYYAFLVYCAAGALFVLPFVIFGVNAIDPEAKESGAAFRYLIAPGVIALWPLLALRWLRRQPPPVERNAHRCSAR